MGMLDEMQGEFFQMLAALGVVAALVFLFWAMTYSIWLFVLPVILVAGGYMVWKQST